VGKDVEGFVSYFNSNFWQFALLKNLLQTTPIDEHTSERSGDKHKVTMAGLLNKKCFAVLEPP